MKKAQRAPYLALANIALPRGGYSLLCSFCRYYGFTGGCGDLEIECRHPLELVAEQCANNVFEHCTGEGEGADCWGFRPDVKVEDAIEMVSLWLRSDDS